MDSPLVGHPQSPDCMMDRSPPESFASLAVPDLIDRAGRLPTIVELREDRMGDLVEFGATKELFFTPKRKETEDYITGRFG